MDDDDMCLSPGSETRRRKSKWQALRASIKGTSLMKRLSSKRKERKLRSNSTSRGNITDTTSTTGSSTSFSPNPSIMSTPSSIEDNNTTKNSTPTLTIKNIRLHNLRTATAATSTTSSLNPSTNSSPLLTTSASVSSTSSLSSRLGSISSPHHHHATTNLNYSPRSPFSPPQSISNNRSPFSTQKPRSPFSPARATNLKPGQIYINQRREGCSYDSYIAKCMLTVSLLVLVMWGKALAILFTSIWFYVVRPARRRPEYNNYYNQLIEYNQFRRKIIVKHQGSFQRSQSYYLLSSSSSPSSMSSHHLSSPAFHSMRGNSSTGKFSIS
ncbi:hypothetical protein PIB30_046048 [Stylosanthes scabra]|uniref:Uncharacterized protein n=1 Tax=Stylosanthes scabra TaxID=79078 RepID=A0ABU6QFS1_9FABA|nr:hypothetical protein [Stylosanthes scabra]